MTRAERSVTALFAAIGLALCLACTADADTIVLKNGSRIVAANVKRENGRVSGETPAGNLSLPDSLVDRVEKDSAGGDLGSPAAELFIAPPATDLPKQAGDLTSTVVRNGAIDAQALQRLGQEAASGAAAAVARAVAAESLASQFEFSRGNVDGALAHAERALELEPATVTLLLNVAYLHLRRGEYSGALDYLERARRVTPDSPEVAKLTGWAYYGLNRLPQAVDEWKRAQQLLPDDEVARALDKAERDLEVERNFQENGSAHFSLHYYGGADPEMAHQVLDQLEEDFLSLTSVLNFTPSDPITVILYTNQVFADITRAPNWVGALNDGRIRIPVQGLASVTPELAAVLRHELTHSLVGGKTHERCPVWLQEGVAQWMEGRRSDRAAPILVALYDRHEDPSLAALEGSWMNLQSDFAAIAYAWSLGVVEAIVHNGGEGDIERLLDRVASEPSTEAAARSALHLDYAGLNRQAGEYLRSAYMH